MGSRGLGLQAAFAAMAIAAVLAVAGCGGGSDSSNVTSSGAQIEAQEVNLIAAIKQANLLCRVSQETREERLRKANAWVDPGTGVTRPLREKIARFVVIEPTETLSKRLQAIMSTGSGFKLVEDFARSLSEAAEDARLKPLTVVSGAAFVESDKLAQKAGLTDCVI